MEISIFFAKFWGSLFMILGLSSLGAKFLGRVIKMTEDKTSRCFGLQLYSSLVLGYFGWVFK